MIAEAVVIITIANALCFVPLGVAWWLTCKPNDKSLEDWKHGY